MQFDFRSKYANEEIHSSEISIFMFNVIYSRGPNECPGKCWHRPGHLLGIKLRKQGKFSLSLSMYLF